MNNKITLVESMAALRKQLHDIESKTINESLKKTGGEVVDAAAAAAKRAMSGEEILSKEIKSWLKKPAVEINKEFKTIEITLPNGTKEVWNATGIKKGKVMYSRAGDNAIASFEDVTKFGTVKNVKTEPSLMPEPGIPPKTTEPTNVVGIDGKPYKVPKEEPIHPAGGDEIKQVDGWAIDPLHPKRIDPFTVAPFKNIEAAKSAADAEIQAGNAIVKAPDGTVFQSAADMESFIAAHYPESAAVLAKSPSKLMQLWSWFSEPKPPPRPTAGRSDRYNPHNPPEPPPAKHTKKVIALVALLILLGIYFWPKNKKSPVEPEGGSAGSEGGGAPIGTEIPADQVPWKWVVTGSTDPNLDLDKIKNGREAYEPVKSQSVTKNQDGKWQTPNGYVLNKVDGAAAARLEQLAKMTPEKRKEMARAETTQSFDVSLYTPGVDGPELPSVSNPNNTQFLPPVGSEVTTNTTPDGTPKPDIVIGKDDAKKKKKKKDEKVLPSSKW